MNCYVYIYVLYTCTMYMSCMWFQPHKLAWKTLVTCTCDHNSVAWTPMQCNLLPTPRKVRHLGLNVWELLRLKSHPLWMSRCMNLIYIYTNIQKLYHTYRLYKYISMQLWHNFPRVSHSDIYMYVYCLGARWRLIVFNIFFLQQLENMWACPQCSCPRIWAIIGHTRHI
jgi:hypothetical protein